MTPKLPHLAPVTDPWGPSSTLPAELLFDNVPYAPFFKGDKLGRVADWVVDTVKEGKEQRRSQKFRDPYHAYGASSASGFLNSADDITSFSVVDTKQVKSSSQLVNRANRGNNQDRGNARKPPGAAQGAQGAGPAQGQAQQSSAGQNGPQANRSRNNYYSARDKREAMPKRDPSVKIDEAWKHIKTIGFNELHKLSFTPVGAAADLLTSGEGYAYNKAVLDKANVPLKKLDRTIYNVPIAADPLLAEVAEKAAAVQAQAAQAGEQAAADAPRNVKYEPPTEPNTTVYASADIISLLMCATKSPLPWDFTITKKGSAIYFDKRADSPLDYVWVDNEPDDKLKEYTLEATAVNNNFRAMAIVANKKVKSFDKPDQFTAPPDAAPVLPQGHIYRAFNVSDNEYHANEQLVVRAEIDSVGPAGELINVVALNNFGIEWKNKFTTSRGAIISSEMKKNLCKLSRWTAGAILGSVDQMKIGFVSRVAPVDKSHHVILGVLSRDPAQFAVQLNLNLVNGWGIVKSIINIAEALDDGKYVLMKDPNSTALQLYQC